MTQSSRPVAGRLTDFPNSDCGPYTGPQWREVYSTLFTRDPTTMGPLRGIDNELEVVVTNSVSENLRVKTGAGVCNGALLLNDANVNFSGAPSGTVVMVLNATNAAYNTNLTFPDDTTDYGVGPSVEAYTCRIAICTSSLIQNNSIWMVPLATYAGGNNLIDDRTFCAYADASLPSEGEVTPTMIENRTRRFLVGWTNEYYVDSGGDHYSGGAPISEGVRLYSLSGWTIAAARASWGVPPDFLSGLTISPVINSAGAGVYRLGLQVRHGTIGQIWNAHSLSWGETNWSDTGPAGFLREVTSLSLPDAAVGDIVSVNFWRDPDDPADTGGYFPQTPGFMVEYIADS